MKFKAVVFDLDGTLVESPIDFVGIRQALGISQSEGILEAISNWAPERKDWGLQTVHRFEAHAAEQSRPIPGAINFLEALKSKGIGTAIFTRNSRATTRITLSRHQLETEYVVTRDDGPPKPNPAGLLEIARHFEYEPEQILLVGDYIYDLQAGVEAGTPTALHLPEPADFNTSGAAFCFRDYSELTAWFFDPAT